ncbi:MAG: hypothetical protein R6X02_16300 [Enhygromyxa sp.]
MTFATSMIGCVVVTDDGSDDEVGDGDGDQTGDGDGDQTGDGDGDATGDGDGDATGDGDGDATGDGDGDATGDGDGEPAGSCGWIEDADPISGYYCGGEGEDPTGSAPIACPDDLVEGEACGTVTGAGCCDADGNNWYCGKDDNDNEFLVFVAC